MKYLSVLLLILPTVYSIQIRESNEVLSHEKLKVLSDGIFSYDTYESYSSCPKCDPVGVNITNGTAPDQKFINTSWSVISEKFVPALQAKDPEKVADTFCDNESNPATLFGTVSQAFRVGKGQIRSYFDFFAKQENNISTTCPEFMDLGNNISLGNVALGLNTQCIRMSFTIDLTRQCIQNLYSSYFPLDTNYVALVITDFNNSMPWKETNGSPNSGQLKRNQDPAPECGQSSLLCKSLTEAKGYNGNKTELANVIKEWVDGLLEQNATKLTGTYCKDAFLWATASNMRRYTEDQIMSYFEWFAKSQNFAESIRNVCENYFSQGPDLFSNDRIVQIGDNCLRMSYQLKNENGGVCIKSLSSSYFPNVPQGLHDADKTNQMPWINDNDNAANKAQSLSIFLLTTISFFKIII